MLKHAIGAAAIAVTLTASVQAADWKIDPVHSDLEFEVKHMVISTVGGRFTEFEGTVTNFDGKNLADASVTVTAKAASINTNNEKRDEHLKSSDFFAVEEHPELTFVSSKVIPGEGNKFQLVGDLTMRGVTREVTFDCTFNGAIEDGWGNTRAGFSAETTINRQDFGVSWSKSLDAGGLVVSNDVEISFNLQTIMAKEG